MEASEMSSMTETATGHQGEKKEEDDSRQKAALVAICCGFLLVLLLIAAAANALDSHENEGGDNGEEDADGNYVIGGGGGGGGKVTEKCTTTSEPTATTTNKDPFKPTGLSTTTTKTETIPTKRTGLSTTTTKTETIPTKPTEPTTTITTTEVIPIKPSTGLSCISGTPDQKNSMVAKVLFSFCKRLVGRMQWMIKGNRTISDFDTQLLNPESYTTYADLIFWAFSNSELDSYNKYTSGDLIRDCNFETWGFPLRRYGLQRMRLKDLIQKRYVKVFRDVLGDLPAEHFILGIETKKGDMKLLEDLDASLFDGVGMIFVTHHYYYSSCAANGAWNDPGYLKYAKILNNKVPQSVAITTSGGAVFLKNFNSTGKNECRTPRLDILYYDRCEKNITVEMKTGRYECKNLWFAVETNETLAKMADYAKSAGFYNCGIDDMESFGEVNKLYMREKKFLDCDRR